jgi:mitochondrial fission protein ELM1
MRQAARADGETQPRVWLVLGDKRGDNAQVYPIETALGWVCEHKYVQMREPYVFGKPRVEASLHHIDPERSDPIEPPWPDLIITVGRRPSMVAMWIREQAGGRTRIVLIGKPSTRLETFDLIIPSGENQLPPLKNVLPITLPLMQVDKTAVAAAAEVWKPRLAELPRPLIAFLVGGPTGHFVFDAKAVDRLIEAAATVAAEGGTPYVTTSRRTPSAVVEALTTRLPAAARLFTWTADAPQNPYHALLGLADGFVVTGDSISMIVEVARMGKPLQIFELPTGRLGSLDQARRALARRLFSPDPEPGTAPLRHRVAKALYRLGLITQTRDFTAFYRMLFDRGLASPLGGGFRAPQGRVPDDLAQVVSRIKALMQQQRHDGGAGAGTKPEVAPAH